MVLTSIHSCLEGVKQKFALHVSGEFVKPKGMIRNFHSALHVFEKLFMYINFMHSDLVVSRTQTNFGKK